jgi:UDP:flavonoid glycosyltransferase YjiC (YdhE family)
MKPRALLIQPGAFGDIITCAPIAKHFHDEGMEVHWAIHEKYKEHLESITSEYVTPVILPELAFPEEEDWLRIAAYQ